MKKNCIILLSILVVMTLSCTPECGEYDRYQANVFTSDSLSGKKLNVKLNGRYDSLEIEIEKALYSINLDSNQSLFDDSIEVKIQYSDGAITSNRIKLTEFQNNAIEIGMPNSIDTSLCNNLSDSNGLHVTRFCSHFAECY